MSENTTAPVTEETAENNAPAPNDGQGKFKFEFNLRNIIMLVLCGVLVFYLLKLNFGFGNGVSGENIKYYSKSENAVYVYSVCPKCDHIGDIWEAKISPGEESSSFEICESCDHLFEISVKRK